ncbi:hypothetical protein [Rhizosphaericola mali]|uniref:Uncharacterized protein n=1 Tax=Rhizosphaericola mali TaxID=2545455 RepID=A0A5P2GGD4_9BACT|nr:hypothetical protein [Rhizosphaericola mali]QES90801.1 hypothetical protein E0W69_019845 [Rhizosphaericola mali]
MDKKLPDLVLAHLFPESIVVLPEDASANAVNKTEDKGRDIDQFPNNKIAAAPELSVPFWLGENKKQVCIILHDRNNVFISEHSLDFLGKILSACQLNIADTAIINMARTPVNLEQIQQYIQPKFLLSFHIKFNTIGLNDDIKLYQPNRKNGCSYLLAGDLDKMNDGSDASKQEKGRFWISLKQLFGI